MRCVEREVRRKRHALRIVLLATLLLLGLVLAPRPAQGGRDDFVEDLEAQIELGRRLFFDPVASPSSQRSCASCHDPDHGYSDPKRLSLDDVGVTTRHSQTILDSGRNPTAHWDGEFGSVAELVTKRIGTSVVNSPWRPAPQVPSQLPTLEADLVEQVAIKPELITFLHAKASPPVVQVAHTEAVAKRIHAHGFYKEAFLAAYGSPDVTIERMAEAIEAYCHSVESTEAPIDRHMRGDPGVLSIPARRGLALFRGRAGCVQCHTIRGERPVFTDYRFRNTGIAWRGVHRQHDAKQLKLLASALNHPKIAARLHKDNVKWLRAVGPIALLADNGRGPKAGVESLDRHFKTPGLRDVAKRPPYMHDGSLKTLEAVVRYYANGGCDEDPTQDSRLVPFEATDQDLADLVAFLESLSGEERPGLATKVWRRRVNTTRVVVSTSRGKPLGLARVELTPEGDTLPVGKTVPRHVRIARTDEDGVLEFDSGDRTHTRLRLVNDTDPFGGALIPDTSRQAFVELDVAGRAVFHVLFRRYADMPTVLPFRHMRNADVVTRAYRIGHEKVATGYRATYEGWVRSERSELVALELPNLLDPVRGGKPAVIRIVLRPEAMDLDLRSYRFK